MLNLKSQIAIKVLGYFFLNHNQEKYTNELARILNVDAGNLDRKLKELEKEGILRSEMRGNQRYYFLNKDYPFLRETKKLYSAKYGLVTELKSKLSKLKGLVEAYIFGSYAKGNLGSESDIDLLLVGDHSSLEAKRAIIDLQSMYQREFNIVDMELNEFEARKKGGDEFLKEIFRNKIIRII